VPKLGTRITRRELERAGDPWPAELEEAALRTWALLEELRARIGRPLFVTSFYRTPEHNARIGGSSNSAHMRALAADISVSATADARAKDSRELAADLARSWRDLDYDEVIWYDDSRGGHVHIGLARPGKRPRLEVLHAPASGGYALWDPLAGEGLQAGAAGRLRSNPGILVALAGAGLVALALLASRARR